MDSIYLNGSEDVARAGHNMRDAAADMLRAANYIDESLRNHQRFMDDWLDRYREMLVAEAVNSGRA